jgi:DNA excision repair protein ERCC-5
MNRREVEGTQANITKFFHGAVGVGAANAEGARTGMKGKESGRMKTAYRRLRGEAERRRRGSGGKDGEMVDETEKRDNLPEEGQEEVIPPPKTKAKELSRKPRKAKKKKRANVESVSNDDDAGNEDNDNSDEEVESRPRKAVKRSTKKPKKRVGALFADSDDEDA